MHFIVSVKLVFHSVFQYVSRLAVQGGADGLQRGETDGLGLVVFQNGQVGQGDIHFLR